MSEDVFSVINTVQVNIIYAFVMSSVILTLITTVYSFEDKQNYDDLVSGLACISSIVALLSLMLIFIRTYIKGAQRPLLLAICSLVLISTILLIVFGARKLQETKASNKIEKSNDDISRWEEFYGVTVISSLSFGVISSAYILLFLFATLIKC